MTAELTDAEIKAKHYRSKHQQHRAQQLVDAADELISGLCDPVSAEGLATLSRSQWSTLAKLAKIKPPSPTTQSLAIAIAEIRERPAPADPFEGLTR